MNEKSVRMQVLNVIEERGVIDNGNVVGTLTDRVKASGIKGRDKVLSALDTLERNGSIGVTRRGSHILKVYPKVKEVCERSDRNDRSPAAKRESMYAKGVPAYLPDELCSPVVIITKEDRALVTPNDMPAKKEPVTSSDEAQTPVEQEEGAAVESAAETSTSADLTFLELLNLAYIGLLHRADPESGELPAGSVHAFIKEDLKEYNPSKHRIKMLNWTFGQLGLRTTTFFGSTATKSEGRRSPRYQSAVDITVDAITQEMLDALKAKPVRITETEAAPTETSVVVDEPVVAPEGVTKKLLKIIKDLETENEKLRKSYQDEVDKNLGLTNQLETEQTLSSKLNTQLTRLKAVPLDPEVASVLEKYNV